SNPLKLFIDPIFLKSETLILGLKFMFQTRFKFMLALFAVGTALVLPLPCGATTQVLLGWQSNTGSNIAGYRVFSRMEGENYDPSGSELFIVQ
ncbi:hypothetical protein ACFL2E_07770, partial [Thermodesulfobacteriota bacterium]